MAWGRCWFFIVATFFIMLGQWGCGREGGGGGSRGSCRKSIWRQHCNTLFLSWSRSWSSLASSWCTVHTAHCRRRQAKVANCSRVGGDPSPSSSEFEQGIADMQSQYVHLSWLVSMLWRHTRPSTHSPPFLLLPVQKCKTPSSFQTDCDPDGGGLLWGGAGGHLVGDFTDSVTHR